MNVHDIFPPYEVQLPALLACAAAAPDPEQQQRAAALLTSEWKLRAATTRRRIDPAMHPVYTQGISGAQLAHFLLHGIYSLRLIRGSVPQVPGADSAYITGTAELVNPAILLVEEVEAAMGSGPFADAKQPYEQYLAWRGFEIASYRGFGIFNVSATVDPGESYPLTTHHQGVDGNGPLFHAGSGGIEVRDGAEYSVELEANAFSESTSNPTDIVLQIWDTDAALEGTHTVARQSADPLEPVWFSKYVHRTTFASGGPIKIKNGGTAAQHVIGTARIYLGPGAVPP